ncbi:MAG: type II toxin-antitoxin system mRNA interferase toxin, RelE/StbE family [Elusimicrobiota bacterium]
MFIVVLPKKVEKEFRHLSEEMQGRIVDVLTNLKTNPAPLNAKQLKGKLSGCRRIRLGHYRIIYEIIQQQKRIIILKIGPRKDVYR